MPSAFASSPLAHSTIGQEEKTPVDRWLHVVASLPAPDPLFSVAEKGLQAMRALLETDQRGVQARCALDRLLFEIELAKSIDGRRETPLRAINYGLHEALHFTLTTLLARLTEERCGVKEAMLLLPKEEEAAPENLAARVNAAADLAPPLPAPPLPAPPLSAPPLSAPPLSAPPLPAPPLSAPPLSAPPLSAPPLPAPPLSAPPLPAPPLSAAAVIIDTSPPLAAASDSTMSTAISVQQSQTNGDVKMEEQDEQKPTLLDAVAATTQLLQQLQPVIAPQADSLLVPAAAPAAAVVATQTAQQAAVCTDALASSALPAKREPRKRAAFTPPPAASCAGGKKVRGASGRFASSPLVACAFCQDAFKIGSLDRHCKREHGVGLAGFLLRCGCGCERNSPSGMYLHMKQCDHRRIEMVEKPGEESDTRDQE